MGNWEEFPNVVGAIDSTPHEIYRPLIEPQRPFYSSYQHYHCMNTQLVMDNEAGTYPLCSGWISREHARFGFLSTDGTYWSRAQLGSTSQCKASG